MEEQRSSPAARAGSARPSLAPSCARARRWRYSTGGWTPAKATADTLAAKGAKVVAVAADVSDESAVKSAVESATKALGRIDILVNNAGIDTTSLVAEMPTVMWDEMIAINLRGVFLCTRAVLPGMIAR